VDRHAARSQQPSSGKLGEGVGDAPNSSTCARGSHLPHICCVKSAHGRRPSDGVGYMDAENELAAVEREVMAIRAAALRCGDTDDADAALELERLVMVALSEGCPPQAAIRLIIEAFTVRASDASQT